MGKTIRKPRIPYEDNHKIIDGVEYKKCGWDCNDWYPMTEEYFYKNKSSKVDGYNPYCKNCTIERTRKWREENPEKTIEQGKTRRAKNGDYVRSYNREYNRKNRDKQAVQQRDWRIVNKNILGKYVKRKHDITDAEWLECLYYFDFTCAYCGLSEEEHYLSVGTQFHQEHVIHDGNNYIDNCVPACKICNSSKHNIDFNNWYNENNPIFSKQRMNKITKWMTKVSLTI